VFLQGPDQVNFHSAAVSCEHAAQVPGTSRLLPVRQGLDAEACLVAAGLGGLLQAQQPRQALHDAHGTKRMNEWMSYA
jgi:hypothetical protein